VLVVDQSSPLPTKGLYVVLLSRQVRPFLNVQLANYVC
jgi:hypothetical protein